MAVAGATLYAAGQNVVVPVGTRLLSTAGPIAASFLFKNPYLVASAVVAAAVAAWLSAPSTESPSPVVPKAVNGQWVNAPSTSSSCTTAPCYAFKMSPYTPLVWVNDACVAAKSAVDAISGNGIIYSITSCSYNNPSFVYTRSVNGVASGAVYNGTIPTQSRAPDSTSATATPLTEEQFKAAFNGRPVPLSLAAQLPVALPVAAPVVNPDANGQAQAITKPIGTAVKSSDGIWRTPIVIITPIPTEANPLAVDVQTATQSNTGATPAVVAPSVTTPTTGATQAPATPDLCITNPTALACATVGSTQLTLPKAPGFYVAKYPGGLLPLLEEKYTQIKATSIMSFANKLMPTGFTSGSCPVMSLNLNVGIANFGVHDVAPPCWVWTFAKTVVIVSSLLLARALIFGG